MDAIKQLLLFLIPTGIVGAIYNAWRNRGNIKIYSVNYMGVDLTIDLENISRELNSISEIKTTGIRYSKSKLTTPYVISKSNKLPINERVTITAKTVQDIPYPCWFIIIKISFTKSRAKKIRLRNMEEWPKSRINLFRFYIEKLLWLYCKNFYYSYIHKIQNPSDLE